MTEVARGLDRQLFEPHVATFHPHGIRADELRADGVPVLHLPVTSFASASALQGGLALIRYIRRHRIRLVHSFDVPLNIFAVPFVKLAHGPVVLSSQRAHRNLTPGIYTRLLRFTDLMVDGIVVNCEHMREHLMNDERVPDSMIHLCYNGIDLSVFHRERMPALPANGTVVIGVVCALRPEKGLANLIEAFATVHGSHANTRLLIVGSGPMLSELEALAEGLRVREWCRFEPKTADVAPWMRAMDIFVLPSLSEALSNSLMESMACGCSCVASRIGGNPELLGSGQERGLLFARGNSEELAGALNRLVGDAGARERFALAGHNFIHEGFSQARSVRRMEKIYEEFLDSN